MLFQPRPDVGTSSPGRGVWAVAALLAGLALACVPWALGERRAWFPRADEWPAIATAPNDWHAAAAAKVYSGQAAAADMLILGDSTMMAGFWDDQPLSTALAEAGVPAQVASLASGGQLPGEALFLMSQRSPRAGQTVFVSFRFSALRRANAADHLDSGAFLRDPVDAATRWHQAHVDERGLRGRLVTQLGLARERLAHQVLWPLRRWSSEHLYRRPWPGYVPQAVFPDRPADPAVVREQWLRSNQQIEQHFDAALAQARDALDELFERLRAAGCRVILLTPPLAGDALASRHAKRKQRYEAVLDALAERHGIERLDLNPRIEWSPGDLGDLVHLSRPGRDKWSRAFVEWALEDAARRLRGG